MGAFAITLFVLGGIAVSLLFVVGASVVVDAVVGRRRVRDFASERVRLGRRLCNVYVARPVGSRGRRAAVILVHDSYGLGVETVTKADALAEEGYVAIAPDAFCGRSTRWPPRARLLTLMASRRRILREIDEVVSWLSMQPDVDPDRIAVVGLRFGGALGLRYCLRSRRLAALAVIGGELVTASERLRALKTPVLGVFGEEDRSVPIERVKEFDRALKEAEVPHRIVTYEGVGHAFVRDVGAREAGGAARDAWVELLHFLDDHLAP